MSARDVNASFDVKTIRTSAVEVTSDSITFPIHSTLTEMVNALTTIQRTIGCSLVRGTSGQSGYQSQSGPTAVYGGWGVSDPTSPPTANNLTITCGASSDQYSVNGTKGYYKQASSTLKVGAALMQSSNLQYTLSFTATDGTTPLTPITTSYYVEIPPSVVPTATLDYSLPGTLTTYFTTVNGINIVKQDIPLTVNLTSISKIGTYFAPDAIFLAVNNGFSSGLTTVANVPADGISTDANGVKTIKDPFDYTPAVTYTYAGVSGYQKTHSISCIINGLKGASAAITSSGSAFSIIYDKNTIDYISSLPSTIPILSGTTKFVGLKVPSPAATSGDIAWHSSGTTPYRSTASNLSQALTSNNELLISNGGFITPATALSGSEIGYGNYGSMLGNTSLSYSSITTSSSARIVTFAHKIPPAVGFNISSYKLEIIFSNTVVSKNGPAEVVLDGKNSGLDIQYRIEDTTQTDSTPSSGRLNTIWIAGNTTAGGRVIADGNNSYTIGNNLHGQVVSPVVSGSTVTYTLSIPTQANGTGLSTVVYTRISINSSVNVTISSVKASLL